MRHKIARLFGGECGHERTLVVVSVGVRREVCEICGHISFEMAQSSAPRQGPASETRELPKAAGF